LVTFVMVENWNRDEPDRAGELHVEPLVLEGVFFAFLTEDRIGLSPPQGDARTRQGRLGTYRGGPVF